LAALPCGVEMNDIYAKFLQNEAQEERYDICLTNGVDHETAEKIAKECGENVYNKVIEAAKRAARED